MQLTLYPEITSALALQFVKAANPKVQMGKCLPPKRGAQQVQDASLTYAS